MAKSKTEKQDVNPAVTEPVTFEFFSGELTDEKTGVRVFQANTMEDPLPNKSGSHTLDYDLVIPFPAGRLIEIFGGEGTGKTTLALEVIGRALASDPKKIALFVNMEKSLNVSLMRTIRTLRPFIDDAVAKKKGCPLWIVNATTGEQALEAIRQFTTMVPHGIVVLDSIDATQPETVLSGEIGDNRVGNHGKLMSDAMRKLVGPAEANNVCIILINQLRDKITMYGDPATTPGGKAVAFYATQRIRLKTPTKADMITVADGAVIGKLINYKVIKNKFAHKLILNNFIEFDLIHRGDLESTFNKYKSFANFQFCLELLLFKLLVGGEQQHQQQQQSSNLTLKRLFQLIEFTESPESIYINCLRKIEVAYWNKFFNGLNTTPVKFMDRLIKLDNVELCYHYLIVYLNYKKEGEPGDNENNGKVEDTYESGTVLHANGGEGAAPDQLSGDDKQIILQIIKMLAESEKWDWCFELRRFIKILEPSGQFLKEIKAEFG